MYPYIHAYILPVTRGKSNNVIFGYYLQHDLCDLNSRQAGNRGGESRQQPLPKGEKQLILVTGFVSDAGEVSSAKKKFPSLLTDPWL